MPNPQMLWSRLNPPWHFVLDIFAVGEKQKLLINLASNDAHKTFGFSSECTRHKQPFKDKDIHYHLDLPITIQSPQIVSVTTNQHSKSMSTTHDSVFHCTVIVQLATCSLWGKGDGMEGGGGSMRRGDYRERDAKTKRVSGWRQRNWKQIWL